MILIADSGSTKTEWALIEKTNKILEFKTIGLNPVFVSTDIIVTEINKTKITEYKKNINQVFFYGAGCSTKNRKLIVAKALENIFVNAEIIVESDLLGAAISQFGETDGIIGILGTGSNTGIYKHNKIVENISSLGYILGDEGSGAVIGKAFIKLYLNNELPSNISSDFYNKFNLKVDDIITKIYKEPFPNRFLASFMPFVYDYRNNKTIKNMLYNSFGDFFNKTILKYNNYQNYELKLIGSIAFYFNDIIREVCVSKSINLTLISKSPLKGLISYYTNKS
jgi:N-acetylglucosamine kinase-like BadF-type ATPase